MTVGGERDGGGRGRERGGGERGGERDEEGVGNLDRRGESAAD